MTSINTNIGAYFAQQNLKTSNDSATFSIGRLSSGNRIIRASDDVAGLSVGTSLRTNVSTLRTALTNTSQASSLLQIADSGLKSISDLLQRQKALAVQANSGTLSDTERAYLNQEFQALASQIDQVAETTTFGSVNLLDGSLRGSNPLRSGQASAVTFANTTSQTDVTGIAFADAAGTYGDTTLYGDLSNGTFEVTSDGGTAFAVSFSYNGTTYVGSEANVNATGGSIVLTNGEGTLTFTVTANLVGAGITADAAGAALFQTQLEDFLDGATAFQTRAIRNTAYTVNGVTVEGAAIIDATAAGATFDGTVLQGLDGGDFSVVSQFYDGFNLANISDFKAVGDAGLGQRYEVTVDGKTYRTNALASSATGIGAANIFGHGNGVVRFYLDGDSTTNPNEYIQLTLTAAAGAANTIDLNTDNAVQGFIDALNKGFGKSGGGLAFQVGITSTDTLSVNVKSAKTSELYQDADGVLQSLDITTVTGAVNASDVIDLAIVQINELRADVGALQSRIDFSAANLESAIQNTDAARADFLDADISEEATKFAQAQVKLQASISVLAQANQLPQNLLKLIG